MEWQAVFIMVLIHTLSGYHVPHRFPSSFSAWIVLTMHHKSWPTTQAGAFQAGYCFHQAGASQAGYCFHQAGAFQAGYCFHQAGAFQAGYSTMPATGVHGLCCIMSAESVPYHAHGRCSKDAAYHVHHPHNEMFLINPQ